MLNKQTAIRVAMLDIGTHKIPVELPRPIRVGDPAWEQSAIRAFAVAFREYFADKDPA